MPTERLQTQAESKLATEIGERNQLLRRTFLVDDELVNREWSDPVQFRFEDDPSRHGKLMLVMRRV